VLVVVADNRPAFLEHVSHLRNGSVVPRRLVSVRAYLGELFLVFTIMGDDSERFNCDLGLMSVHHWTIISRISALAKMATGRRT